MREPETVCGCLNTGHNPKAPESCVSIQVQLHSRISGGVSPRATARNYTVWVSRTKGRERCTYCSRAEDSYG